MQPQPTRKTLLLDRDGAQLCQSILSANALAELIAVLVDQPTDQAGVRLYGLGKLQPFIDPSGPLGAVVAQEMEGTPRPVRALLFNKTASANWSLAWHQDRVIAVKARVEVPGFGPWTRKQGALHVAPPVDVFAKMITLRVHLDAVSETNAPLLIAPGSHRLGRIAEQDVADVVKQCGVIACLAEAGDGWLYSTPILHASEAARKPNHRRVLQVDYAVGDLPGGLEWLGV